MNTPRWPVALGLTIALAISAVGPAAAQDDAGTDPSDVAAVSGTVILTQPTPGDVTVTDGIVQTSATIEGATLEASDPRLAGALSIVSNLEVHQGALDGAVDFIIEVDTLRVVNDGGSWDGSTTVVGRSDSGLLPATIILRGSGGYEGLTAVLLQRFDEAAPQAPVPLEGFIFPGEGPPTPEAATGE